jgi:hexulose-6-phosphate isomerase
MKRGISYWSFEHGLDGTQRIDEALQQADRAGFEALELCIGTTGVLSVKTTERECAAIRRAADASGLVVDSVASGMSWETCPTHPDPRVRREAIALHKAALQRCAWLGCRSFLFVPGAVHIPWKPDFPAVPYLQAITWSGQAVKALLPVAERLNVEICIENVWNGLFYSPLEFREFIDAFGSRQIRAYFDIGNVLGYHQDPSDWIRILGRRIGRVHAKDFKRSIGTLAGFCDLGQGDVPWKEVSAALHAIGYDRTVIAEMMPWRPDLLRKTARALKRLLAD